MSTTVGNAMSDPPASDIGGAPTARIPVDAVWDPQLARIGRYEIVATLGQGAMGVVYKARDPQLDRMVALKTLRQDLGLPPEQYGDLKKRFYQEAIAAGRLNHPGIAAIHDVIELDGVPYIVMEYVEGRTLAAILAAEGPMDPPGAVRLAVELCQALQYAHARGVVHRDIKPANIMVTTSGVAKVTDFGIARITGSEVTQAGVILGTPSYMSPEQLGARPVDARSDLFSLAVAIYEAMTGTNPFQHEDLMTVLSRIVMTEPPPARQRNPGVSPALDAVLARGLAKQPDERYASADEFAAALIRALDAGEAPTEVLRRARTTAQARHRRWLRPAAFGVLCLFLLAVGGVALWQWWWAQRFGSIVVTTNPSVEVFVDAEFKGRTGLGPLVLAEIPAGERRVTLRLGTREWGSSGTVRREEPLALSYSFPEDRPSRARTGEGGRVRGGQDALRDVQGTLKGVLDKGRETVGQVGSALDKLWKGQ